MFQFYYIILYALQNIDELYFVIRLKEVCIEISKRYEIMFIEIGAYQDHVHFLIQSVTMESPTKIMRIVKSITVKSNI